MLYVKLRLGISKVVCLKGELPRFPNVVTFWVTLRDPEETLQRTASFGKNN